MVAIYEPSEKIPDGHGGVLKEIKVVGNFLPTATGMQFDMAGRWENGEKGIQFKMESYQQQFTHNKDGVVAYLSSGVLKGVGKATAERIYDAYQERSLEMLEDDPGQLLSFSNNRRYPGEVTDKAQATIKCRDTIAYLMQFGITRNKALAVCEHFGEHAAQIVKQHPYRLCEVPGIGFVTADRIALNMGLNPCGEERIEAGILYALKTAEKDGHLCFDEEKTADLVLTLLNTPELNKSHIADSIAQMRQDKLLVEFAGRLYRPIAARTEALVASSIQKLLNMRPAEYKGDIDMAILEASKKRGIILDLEQRSAVKMALKEPISIITGGPGTGKTSIQRIILDVLQRSSPNVHIVCCAPTGRAARRMAQSTGFPASTIHRALGLAVDEDAGRRREPHELDADVVIIDEVSMVDIYLMMQLLKAMRRGCRLILTGDADQLPSVGPGAVLGSLIECGKIPVVQLDKVYRQLEDSRIAVNAAKIRHNDKQLDYGGDFRLIHSTDLDKSADLLETLYLQEVEQLGIDNVALLTPLRERTPTSVEAMNERLRDRINPPSAAKPELKIGKRLYRKGDRVMETRNKEDVSNGDMGTITDIRKEGREATVTVEFGGGRHMIYDRRSVSSLELGYITTVHKSQGSEYISVLLSLQSAHGRQLMRPLLYTAITRAKRRVTIVGEKRAVCIAINRVDTQKRNTMLAARLNGELLPIQKKSA